MNERLGKSDWLDHALSVLAKDGVDALKAEPLARSLGVSRGSFYWHFADLNAFHTAVLETWQHRTTQVPINEVSAQPAGLEQLKALARIAYRSNQPLERAVRAWATRSELAADLVSRVDSIRVAFLEQLLEKAGLSAVHIPFRARFLYWSVLGRIMQGDDPAETFSDAEIDRLASLIVRND